MRPQNFLLKTVSDSEFEILSPFLSYAAMPVGRVVEECGMPIPSVYFPNVGVVSVVCPVDKLPVEVATIGPEGFVGLPVLLGGNQSQLRAFSQIAGDGYMLASSTLRELLPRTPHLHRLLLLAAQSVLQQMSQSTACNRTHSILQRCARWLLMTHDRVVGDQFSLTQEYLGEMLGVRRPQVNRAALALSQAGLISYSRGRLHVLDRAGLERQACPCYQIIRSEQSRVLEQGASEAQF